MADKDERPSGGESSVHPELSEGTLEAIIDGVSRRILAASRPRQPEATGNAKEGESSSASSGGKLVYILGLPVLHPHGCDIIFR